MLSVRPFTTRLLRRLRRRDVLAAADEVRTLHPAERRWAPPAISLPDDTDRVISCTGQSSPELERERLSSGWKEHGATIVRSLHDAVLLDGCVYAKGGYLDVRQTRRRFVDVPAWERLDEALLCSTDVDCRYFGHWPVDALPLELLASSLALEPVTVAKPRWGHEPGYRTLLGMADRQVSAAKFRKLWIANDRGLNQGRLARFTALRAQLASAVDATIVAPRRPVFIARGSLGKGRTLVNEADIAEALAKQGFIILRPEAEQSITIARVMRAASMVVAVEGSAQGHAILGAPAGIPFVNIMPPRELNSLLKPLCDGLDMPWGFTVADDLGPGRFSQPIDRLERLIDAMWNAAKG